MTDASAAVLVSILLVGPVALSPIMGRLGHRWSDQGVMSIGALGAAPSAVLAWKATSAAWFYAIFSAGGRGHRRHLNNPAGAECHLCEA